MRDHGGPSILIFSLSHAAPPAQGGVIVAVVIDPIGGNHYES